MLDLDAPVPSGLVHRSFVLTPLTTAQVALDYAAYMASPEVIRVHSDGRWPIDGFTVEQNRDQALRHESDHKAHRAFTFLILSRDASQSLGCVYLNPLRGYLERVGAEPQTLSAIPEASAMATFWVVQDRQHTGLVAEVAEAVNTWLMTAWPLRTHLFRVLPAEKASLAALDRLALQRVSLELRGEKRPYVWYRPDPVRERAAGP